MEKMIEQGICQRTLTVDLRWQKDGNENLWFVAKDVCDMLGLDQVTNAIKSLDEDEKGLTKVKTLGGEQEMNIISESGMYALIMRSNKENESLLYQKIPIYFKTTIAKIYSPNIAYWRTISVHS